MSEADAALHHLFEANRVLRDAGERIAAEAGQTHARRMVLQTAEDGGATVPDIARRLGLQRQGIQRIADELVAEGFGRYEGNPRHRRSKIFVLTKAGTEVLAEIRRAHDRWIGTVEDRTADVDWTRLRRDLARLVERLRDPAG